jgi:hypothetical protein
MTVTNANNAKLAACIASARPGFGGIVYTKKGKVRGGVLYENDTVHDVFCHSFHYAGDKGLKARDFDALAGITDKEILDQIAAEGLHGWSGRGRNATPVEVTKEHVAHARAKIEASCLKSATGRNSATTDDVYVPLVVNGKPVRGARVYVCSGKETCRCSGCNPSDKRAPVPGTIYLRGLLESRNPLVDAPNGKAPAPKSNPVTVARRLFEKRLPSRRYVTYALTPGTDFFLAIDGTHVTKAVAA